MDHLPFLSLIIFLPTIGALVLVGFNKNAVDPMRFFTTGVTVVTFLLTLVLWFSDFNYGNAGIQPDAAGVSVEWIGAWNIHYRLGYDGISLLPLIRGERNTRGKAIGFLNKDGNESVWMEDRYKLVVTRKKTSLYDIPADAAEKMDLSDTLPEVKARMQARLEGWKAGVMEALKRVPR